MENKSNERLELEKIALEQLADFDDLDFCLIISNRILCSKCPLYQKCNEDSSCFQNLFHYLRGVE